MNIKEWLPHLPWQGPPIPRFFPGWGERASAAAISAKLQKSEAAPAFLKKLYAGLAPVERGVAKRYGLDMFLPQSPGEGPPVPRALPGWPEAIMKIIERK